MTFRSSLVSLFFLGSAFAAHSATQDSKQKLQETQDCQPAFVNAQGASVRGLLYFRCHLEKSTLPGDAQKYFSFFSRLRSGHWNNYDWDLGPKELRGLGEAESFAKAHAWIGLWSVSEVLNVFYNSQGISVARPFTAFVLRVKPCTNGDGGRYFADILTSEYERDPKEFIRLLLEEQKRYAGWLSNGGQNYCQNGAQAADKSIIPRAFARSLNMIWGSFKKVPNKSKEDFRHLLDQARSNPELAGFIEEYNSDLDAER